MDLDFTDCLLIGHSFRGFLPPIGYSFRNVCALEPSFVYFFKVDTIFDNIDCYIKLLNCTLINYILFQNC